MLCAKKVKMKFISIIINIMFALSSSAELVTAFTLERNLSTPRNEGSSGQMLIISMSY